MTDFVKNLHRNCTYQRAKGTDRDNGYPEGEHKRDCDICQGADEIIRLSAEHGEMNEANVHYEKQIERLTAEIQLACAHLVDMTAEKDQLTAEVTNLRELASMVWVNSCIESPVSTDYVVSKEHMLALRDYVQKPVSGSQSQNDTFDATYEPVHDGQDPID